MGTLSAGGVRHRGFSAELRGPSCDHRDGDSLPHRCSSFCASRKISSMFNLETAIAEWRRQMIAAGVKTPVPLEELESHLREEIEQRIRSGATAEQAFALAANRIGCGDKLKAEFGKVEDAKKMHSK